MDGHGGLNIKTYTFYLFHKLIILKTIFLFFISINFVEASLSDKQKILDNSVFSIESFEHGVTANAFLVNFNKNTWVFTNAHVCGGREQSIEKNKKDYFYLNGRETSYYRYLSSDEIILDKKNDLCSFPLSKKINKTFLSFSNVMKPVITSENFRMVTKFKGIYKDFKNVKVIDKDCTSIYSCEKSRKHQKGRKGNMITDLKIKQGMSGSPIINKNLEVTYIAYGRLEYRVGSYRDVFGLIQGGGPLKKFVERVKKVDSSIKKDDNGFLFLLVKNRNKENVVVTI